MKTVSTLMNLNDLRNISDDKIYTNSNFLLKILIENITCYDINESEV